MCVGLCDTSSGRTFFSTGFGTSGRLPSRSSSDSSSNLQLQNPGCRAPFNPALTRSRELTEAAAPGGGLAAATVLALALAWANVDPPSAAADFELPFSVRNYPYSLGGAVLEMEDIGGERRRVGRERRWEREEEGLSRLRCGLHAAEQRQRQQHKAQGMLGPS